MFHFQETKQKVRVFHSTITTDLQPEEPPQYCENDTEDGVNLEELNVGVGNKWARNRWPTEPEELNRRSEEVQPWYRQVRLWKHCSISNYKHGTTHLKRKKAL